MSPNDINNSLGYAGAGATVEALGQTWTFMPASYGIQAQFEQWLQAGAEDRIMDAKDRYDARSEEWNEKNRKLPKAMRRPNRDLYREQMEALQIRIDAGHYSWAGDILLQSLAQINGMVQMSLFCLQERHPNIDAQTVKDIMADAGPPFTLAYQKALRLGDPNVFGGEEESPPTPPPETKTQPGRVIPTIVDVTGEAGAA